MRTTIISALALASLHCAGTAYSQEEHGDRRPENSVRKEETIILKQSGQNGKTVVEIKDGNVYVNGEKVADIKDAGVAGIRKKIVIEGNGGPGQDFSQMPFFDQDENESAPRKAMLGVLTNPQSKGTGALIREVSPNSAAAKAGLQSGDRILKVDGAAIDDAKALVETIGRHEAGDKVAITYERDGRTESTNAELTAAEPRGHARAFRFGPGNMPDMPNSMMRDFPFPASDDPAEATPKMGVTAEDRADGTGVRVLDVKPQSPADKAGLKEGDVILQLGDDKVSSVDELLRSLRDVKPAQKVRLQYQRNGHNNTADLVLPRAVKRRDL